MKISFLIKATKQQSKPTPANTPQLPSQLLQTLKRVLDGLSLKYKYKSPNRKEEVFIQKIRLTTLFQAYLAPSNFISSHYSQVPCKSNT